MAGFKWKSHLIASAGFSVPMWTTFIHSHHVRIDILKMGEGDFLLEIIRNHDRNPRVIFKQSFPTLRKAQGAANSLLAMN